MRTRTKYILILIISIALVSSLSFYHSMLIVVPALMALLINLNEYDEEDKNDKGARGDCEIE